MTRRLAGCVPVSADGQLCLVESKNHPGYYVFPKGGVEEKESDMSAAIRETFEEAGIEGKLVHDLCDEDDCHWFVMRVTKVHASWPENRRRIWVDYQTAVKRNDLVSRSKVMLEHYNRIQHELD